MLIKLLSCNVTSSGRITLCPPGFRTLVLHLRWLCPPTPQDVQMCHGGDILGCYKWEMPGVLLDISQCVWLPSPTPNNEFSVQNINCDNFKKKKWKIDQRPLRCCHLKILPSCPFVPPCMPQDSLQHGHHSPNLCFHQWPHAWQAVYSICGCLLVTEAGPFQGTRCVPTLHSFVDCLLIP